MTGYTDASAQAALDALITAYPWVSLFTATGTDAGTGFTEAGFTGYARVNSTGLWAAASGSAPSTKANNATIAFPNALTVGSDIIAFGLHSLVTAGVMGFWANLGNFQWQPATFSLASPSVVTLPGHGFANGDKLIASAEAGSEGTIAAGWTAGLLTVAGVTTDTFTAGVNAANTGGIMIRKVAPQSVVANMVIQFLSGQLIASLA
jgi:hypothetical protein